jgi:hypothetical protein
MVGSLVLGTSTLISVMRMLNVQLYTDTIYFAPLSSSFDPTSTSASSRAASISNPTTSQEIKTRRDWIQVWMHEHGIDDTSSDDESPVGPRPVSAKAVYRLADKLDLPALKLRAFQHISSQLTAQNIPAEVFSRFSSTFEDVRKVSSVLESSGTQSLMDLGTSGILLETLGRDQKVGQHDAHLAADSTRKACWFRRG